MTLCAASEQALDDLREVGFDPADVPEPRAGQVGGWGLHIVRQMARSWDVSRPITGGVTVSFELDLA